MCGIFKTMHAHPSSPDALRRGPDFEAVAGLFRGAEQDRRDVLFEHETYALLKHCGAEIIPGTIFLGKGALPGEDDLARMPGEKVVLKVVSPAIFHKTEVGGVRIVAKAAGEIRTALERMMIEIPGRLAERIRQDPSLAPAEGQGLPGEVRPAAIAGDIRGILMVEHLPPDSAAFGNELIVGIRRSREFGMVISAGLGGTDTELYAEAFRKGRAAATAATAMTDGQGFFDLFRSTVAYRKLAGWTRGRPHAVDDARFIACFSAFIAVANHFSPDRADAPYVIEELEINPFVLRGSHLVPLDGLCRFSGPSAAAVPRPIHKIDRLLHPRTIGLVGASAGRMNFGRSILKRITASGFDPERITVIKPGAGEIDGLKCVPNLAALSFKLDLLVLAVDASNVPELVDEVLKRDCAHAVMLIPGGLGETAGSRDLADHLGRRIGQAHRSADGGPVFLGGNCLGVVSRPGRFDTLPVPEEKLPGPRGTGRRAAALLSQSGAFMITRLSKRALPDPAYMVSVGNQTDLTLGDLMAYLKEIDGLSTLAVYAEGFKPMDGLAFVRAVRRAVLKGMDVVFYKAGRTPEGRSAARGHTAAVAGDYRVCESCVRQAGAMVAQSFTQFDGLLLLSERLHGKKIRGNRIAGVSSAGFEAVGMADRIQTADYTLEMAPLAPATCVEIGDVLKQNRLDLLVEVRNPLDINPGSDDRVHARIVEILSRDPHVDAVVVGIIPLGYNTRTLPGVNPYGFESEESFVRLLPPVAARSEKPVIAVVDSGALYDPMVAALEGQGMVVFRSSDQALDALGRYIGGRLTAERIRLDARQLGRY
jgi:acyl-CoA synthetase (NDP forming)